MTAIHDRAFDELLDQAVVFHGHLCPGQVLGVGAFGLEPAEGQPEVEDHVAAELEFMSVLALKEAWALADQQSEGLEITLAAQRAFLTDHLARWSVAFAGRVVTTATPGFYPAAAARGRERGGGRRVHLPAGRLPRRHRHMARAGRLARIAMIVTATAIVAIQLVPYGRDHVNPPGRQDSRWDSARVRALARRVCGPT